MILKASIENNTFKKNIMDYAVNKAHIIKIKETGVRYKNYEEILKNEEKLVNEILIETKELFDKIIIEEESKKPQATSKLEKEDLEIIEKIQQAQKVFNLERIKNLVGSMSQKDIENSELLSPIKQKRTGELEFSAILHLLNKVFC
jgi:hypothetical protein